MDPIERPRAYLEAVAVGLSLASPMELPAILREIARNVNVLADEADRKLLAEISEPDDY